MGAESVPLPGAMTAAAGLFLSLVAVVIGVTVYRQRHSLHWPGFMTEVALLISAVLVYFLVRGLTEGSEATAVANAQRVVEWEQALGIHHEAWLQSLIVDEQRLVTLMNWIYIWGHWPVIATVGIWLLVEHRDTYPLVRTGFLISGAIGLVIFATFPVAPPRMVDAAVVDTITQHSQSYRVLQPPQLTNVYAAMPSLHFGWNLLVGLTLARVSTHWGPRAFGVVMPMAMLVAVVLTANHFILDTVAGAVVAGTGFGAALGIRTLKERRRAQEAGRRPGAAMPSADPHDG